jgi:hypothetical protein
MNLAILDPTLRLTATAAFPAGVAVIETRPSGVMGYVILILMVKKDIRNVTIPGCAFAIPLAAVRTSAHALVLILATLVTVCVARLNRNLTIFPFLIYRHGRLLFLIVDKKNKNESVCPPGFSQRVGTIPYLRVSSRDPFQNCGTRGGQ